MACPQDSSVVTEEVAEWQGRVGRTRSRGTITMTSHGASCSVVTALANRNGLIGFEAIKETSVSEITDLAKNRKPKPGMRG